MNSADRRTQDAGKVPARGRDKLQGETDVDRPTLTRGVLSDGAEEVNQLNTVRVTTRAKRGEIDRSQTENEFMRHGTTATKFKGDSDTQTYEPAVETESGSDRETDDTLGSDEIDLTDQTVQIPDDYATTIGSGDNFLMHDSGAAATDRVTVFATDCALKHLAETHTWFMDGTFSTAPKLFEQLYIIRAPLDDGCRPVASGGLGGLEPPHQRFEPPHQST